MERCLIKRGPSGGRLEFTSVSMQLAVYTYLVMKESGGKYHSGYKCRALVSWQPCTNLGIHGSARKRIAGEGSSGVVIVRNKNRNRPGFGRRC